MIIKFKKLDGAAQTPVKSSSGAAAYDLIAISHTIVGNKPYTEYDTGIAMEIPEGYVGLAFARSSISNTGAILANGVGVIDPDYRGSIKARFYGTPYENNDKIVQLIILKTENVIFEEVEELSETTRGIKGFGSTGK